MSKVFQSFNMIQIFLFNLATVSAGKMHPYIVGGEEVTINKWPFIAFVEISMFSYSDAACGGSLISSQTVLTAAHCLDDITQKKTVKGCSFKIFMGHAVYSRAKMYRQVLDYETHHKYSPSDKDVRYDIGIMFLTRPVSFSANIQKAILQPRFDLKKDKHLVVAGWGNTDPDEQGGTSEQLKAVKMKSKKLKRCSNLYKVICTKTEDDDYPYTGDSGGPIVKDGTYHQVGIVSFRDMTKGISAFTSVPEYWDWIKNNQLKLFKRFCKNGK